MKKAGTYRGEVYFAQVRDYSIECEENLTGRPISARRGSYGDTAELHEAKMAV
jgi:hypothetical protein